MPSNKVGSTTPEPQNKDHINDELANGPLEKRSCRDVLCCLLFIAFMGGMIAVAAYGLSIGQPTLLGRGYDEDGNMCGVTKDYESYPYVYFAYPLAGHLLNTVCVKTCPIDSSASAIECKPTTNHPACAKDRTNSDADQRLFIYESVGFLNRVCLPTGVVEGAGDATSEIFSNNTFQRWIGDIKNTWQVIAVSVAAAFVIGLIYMILMKYCSGVLTWIAILAFIVGTAILGWRFYQLAKDIENGDSSSETPRDSNSVKSYKIIGYICWGIAGASLITTLCLFGRIKLAIAILKAAADYVKETWSVFIVPIVAVIILAAFYAYWAVTSVYLVTGGDPKRMDTNAFATFDYSKKLEYYMIYHLFGGLWITAFVGASVQFIIASSVAMWYFSQGTGQGASGTVRKSTWRLFRYHFGSIAFGSLILAIVQLIRIILAYMEAQAKKTGAKDNKLAQFAFKCLQCYLACFERFIKFLNKNAYIQIALSGKNFCFAAKDGFLLAMGNPLRYSVLYGITGIFVLFGKVFISALTALGAYLVITKVEKFKEEVYSPVIPTLVVLVFAYGIGNVFMTVYGMASETILACFVLDEELNKKKNAPPRHCPESLRGFLDMHQKKNN